MENRNLLKILFSFKGRMARKPFWMAYIANTLARVLLVLMFAYMTQDSSFVSEPTHYLLFWGVMAMTLDPRGAVLAWMTIPWSTTHWLWVIIGGIPLLVLMINRWSLISRRFHDTNHRFATYLWLLFLRIGIIAFLGILVPTTSDFLGTIAPTANAFLRIPDIVANIILPIVSIFINWGILIGILFILLQRSKTKFPNTILLCKTCLNREYNLKEGGLLCRLNHEKPTFESTCSSYQEDTETKEEELKRQKLMKQEDRITWLRLVLTIIIVGVIVIFFKLFLFKFLGIYGYGKI